MKTSIRISIILISLFLIFSCSSSKKLTEKTVILPLSDTTVLKEGSIIYGLPRTVFTVSAVMERTIEIPGPYAKYAADLLGLTDVIQEETESWSIEGITVKSFEELDPSELYVVESNTLFQSNVLALKKEGIILDLNPAIYLSDTGHSTVNNNGAVQYNDLSDLGSDEYFQVQSDTAYKRVSVDSTFIRLPYIVEKKKRLTLDQLAERAAKHLMELREGKHMILTGEANVFPQSDASINEINRLEKAYTELFTGKVIKEKKNFSCQIIPLKEMAGNLVTIFQFSELTGPVIGMTSGGVPVTIEFTPEKKTKDLTIVAKPKIDSEGEVYDKLFYRVPDIVNIKISSGNVVLFNSRKLIFQFGEVIQLPANYIIGK
jgi:hypothetical protein